MTPARPPRVIVALDFADPAPALALAERLDPARLRAQGRQGDVRRRGAGARARDGRRGFSVFLDLKFHDIPNTVAQACAAATRLGVWMLNVHAAGGRAMLAAAREAVDAHRAPSGRAPPLLIAVTVLTSLADADLRDDRHRGRAAQQALRLARLTGGLRASTASSARRRRRRRCGSARRRRSSSLRRASGRPARRATTRRASSRREAAIANGADYLVIGRPITQAADPVAALAAINASRIGGAA